MHICIVSWLSLQGTSWGLSLPAEPLGDEVAGAGAVGEAREERWRDQVKPSPVGAGLALAWQL